MMKLTLPPLQPHGARGVDNPHDHDRRPGARRHPFPVGAGRLRALVAVTSVAGTLAGLGLARPALAQGPFSDVPPNHWAYEAINELASRGILKGFPDGTFRGQQVVTRNEFAVASQRALQNIQQQLAGPKLAPAPSAAPQDRGSQAPAPQRGATAATREEFDRLRTDVDQLRRLMDQLRETMATLRTEVDQLKQQVGTLKTRPAAGSQPQGNSSPGR